MATSNFPEHEILCQLEKSVLDTIKDYGESVGDPQKQPKMLEASIQSKFSQLRALTRDLEELVEELDRYYLCFHSNLYCTPIKVMCI